jgi:hypothetical protein
MEIGKPLPFWQNGLWLLVNGGYLKRPQAASIEPILESVRRQEIEISKISNPTACVFISVDTQIFFIHCNINK